MGDERVLRPSRCLTDRALGTLSSLKRLIEGSHCGVRQGAAIVPAEPGKGVWIERTIRLDRLQARLHGQGITGGVHIPTRILIGVQRLAAFRTRPQDTLRDTGIGSDKAALGAAAKHVANNTNAIPLMAVIAEIDRRAQPGRRILVEIDARPTVIPGRRFRHRQHALLGARANTSRTHLLLRRVAGQCHMIAVPHGVIDGFVRIHAAQN